MHEVTVYYSRAAQLGDSQMSDVRCVATIEDYEKLDIRVGRIVEVSPFPEGKYSTHFLRIDLGPK
jgi:tRNA-binding EMAP/Myf-like protein